MLALNIDSTLKFIYQYWKDTTATFICEKVIYYGGIDKSFKG